MLSVRVCVEGVCSVYVYAQCTCMLSVRVCERVVLCHEVEWHVCCTVYYRLKKYYLRSYMCCILCTVYCSGRR
jgi:hypothetical protein